MDDGEAELPLRKILCEALVLGVLQNTLDVSEGQGVYGKTETRLRALKVHVIISDLEVHAEQIHKRYIVTILALAFSISEVVSK